MQSTAVKQLIYGTLYVAILGVLGYFLFSIFSSPPTCFDSRKNQGEDAVDCGGPCISCAVHNLAPLQAGSVELVPAPLGQTSAFFELRNPNATYGAENIRYTLTFFDGGGNTLMASSHTTFLYAGEIRILAHINLAVPLSSITRAEAVLTAEPEWQPAAVFSEPGIETRNLTLSETSQGTLFTLQGLISNKNPFAIERASIGAVARNSAGLPIGISKTLVTDLAPSEERAFSLVIPLAEAATLTLSQLQLFIEVER